MFCPKALSSKETLVICLAAYSSCCIYHSCCPLATSIPRLLISCFQIRLPDPDHPVARRVRQVCCNHDRSKTQKTMFRTGSTGTDSQLCSVQGTVLRLRSSPNTLLMSFLISIAVRKLRFGMVENLNSALDLLQSVQKCSFVYFSREFDPHSRNLLLLFRLFFWTFSPAWW